jgi:hypothetical protein
LAIGLAASKPAKLATSKPYHSARAAQQTKPAVCAGTELFS